MAKKLVYSMIAVASLGLAGSFNGCTCNGEAHMGSNTEPKTPPPAPPPPAPAPPPPAPAPPPPAPAPAPVPKQIVNVGKAKIEGNKVKIPGELEFDVDKATLKTTPQSTEILTTLNDFLKQNPQVTKLKVEGHTDNSGTAEHNQTLSQDRANAVVKYLVDKGIDKNRLVAEGLGQNKPIVPNDSAEHKALNRRTEFHVLEIDGVKQTEAPSTTPPAAGTTATPTPTATAAVKPGDKNALPPAKPAK